MRFPFVGGAYLSSVTNFDQQRCVNLKYVSGESGTSKTPAMLTRTEGLTLLAALAGSGGIRAIYAPTNGGDLVVVRGGTVYRVDIDWVATEVGSIDALTSPVSIKDNGGSAVLATGPNGYTLALGSNVLAGMSGFPGGRFVCYNDTVFIVPKSGTFEFYVSASNGALTIGGLDFGSASSNAEPIIAAAVNHGELLLFKKTVTEVFRDTGNADFQYGKDANASIEQGCGAAYSIVELDNTVFWLGREKAGSGLIWRLNGYTPERVSDEGVEAAIQRYGDFSDAVAYGYQRNGHAYYVISFPTGNATWCYDVKERKWHERSYLNPATGMLVRHRTASHAFFNGKHIVGDWENGNLYLLDEDCYSDNGDPLLALRSCAYIVDPNDMRDISFDRLQLDVEVGVGLQSGQGSDPVIMLRATKNGSKTWGRVRTLGLGAVGKYLKRVFSTRFGTAPTMAFEVSCSDPVKLNIMGATLKAVPVEQ